MKLIYVLIDGVSDITNDIITKTPLEIANTKNLDRLVHNGIIINTDELKNIFIMNIENKKKMNIFF